MTVRWAVCLGFLLFMPAVIYAVPAVTAVTVETRHALSLQTPAQSTRQTSLQPSVVSLAARDLSVRERTNRNDHPRIDEVLTYMGLPLRLPYCASFVCWWYNHAGYGRVLPRIGGVMELKRRTLADELRFKKVRPEDVRLGIVPLQEADIVIWNHGGGKGHTGITTRQLDRDRFETIEANTQPGDAGNQREGGGVYRRVRRLQSSARNPVDCFLRVR